MRHVPLPNLLSDIFGSEEGEKLKQKLSRAQKQVDGHKEKEKGQAYISKNGAGKWTPLKEELIKRWGKKCWYTEVIPLGSDLTIDHYRPKRHYQWMAFDPQNLRVACAYSNSPHHNSVHGCTGGKGDEFPLLDGGVRANPNDDLSLEKPVVLDPCSPNDCALLAFQSDGRPVIHPNFAASKEALYRVEASKIILNLDHPEFNKAREKLYHVIAKLVRRHDQNPKNSKNKLEIEEELIDLISPLAEFSMAARFYLRFYSCNKWVAEILRKHYEKSL